MASGYLKIDNGQKFWGCASDLSNHWHSVGVPFF